MTGELLRPIKSECSILIVEHGLDFIRSFCESSRVLEQGKVIAPHPWNSREHCQGNPDTETRQGEAD